MKNINAESIPENKHDKTQKQDTSLNNSIFTVGSFGCGKTFSMIGKFMNSEGTVEFGLCDEIKNEISGEEE